MARITKEYKIKLGEILADWYRNFGRVAPRRDYHDDDQGSGGAAASPFESHPLLAQLPVGAPSDLAAIIINNSRNMDEAKKRIEEASPELQQKLDNALNLGKKHENQYRSRPKPQPF